MLFRSVVERLDPGHVAGDDAGSAGLAHRAIAGVELAVVDSDGARGVSGVGAHPGDGAPVKVLAGRYGPYIKHGSTNANIPKGKDPQDVTLEEAVALLAEREAKGGGKKKPAKGAAKPKAEKAPAKKAAAKKPAAKKPAARKPAAKKAAEPVDADGAPPWDEE